MRGKAVFVIGESVTLAGKIHTSEMRLVFDEKSFALRKASSTACCSSLMMLSGIRDACPKTKGNRVRPWRWMRSHRALRRPTCVRRPQNASVERRPRCVTWTNRQHGGREMKTDGRSTIAKRPVNYLPSESVDLEHSEIHSIAGDQRFRGKTEHLRGSDEYLFGYAIWIWGSSASFVGGLACFVGSESSSGGSSRYSLGSARHLCGTIRY